MKNIIFIFLSVILFLCCSSENDPILPNKTVKIPIRSIVLAEQATKSVVIIDADTYQKVWSWNAVQAGVPAEHQIWFTNPSEVKPVYNGQYILMTASGGAVALIRIADSKLMYYAQVGSNPHSAELLPDGNIVAVSSTDSKLRTFVTDTIKGFGKFHASYELPSAHNVVWDRKRSVLYTTQDRALYSYKYNNDSKAPMLLDKTLITELPKTESCGHDLFPVQNKENSLWLTTNETVWQYDIETKTLERFFSFYAVKSVSDSKEGMLMLYPTTEWWSDGLINEKGKKIFTIRGAKIYKGRWMQDNTFSYPKSHLFKLGN